MAVIPVHPTYKHKSIIIPILNGEKWIDACFKSILSQTVLRKDVSVEMSIYNDASSDNTSNLLLLWKDILMSNSIPVIITTNVTGFPKGAGFAKNAAIATSSGRYLCFQDIDDVMLPERMAKQFEVAQRNLSAIIGCKFLREPPSSTGRYTNWANSLSQEQLHLQIYTAHGPTVILPTWFCHRNVFDRVGNFSEDGKGTPEDLIFFYKHIDAGGAILRLDEHLLIYTYYKESTTFTISSDTIWDMRIQKFLKDYLHKWNEGFTVWNGGKQGRKFIKSLNDEQKKLVKALCDVDRKKIGKHYELFCPIQRRVTHRFPMIHFKEAKPPLVICVKLDLTDGCFEKNLDSLNLEEGKDYIIFS